MLTLMVGAHSAPDGALLLGVRSRHVYMWAVFTHTRHALRRVTLIRRCHSSSRRRSHRRWRDYNLQATERMKNEKRIRVEQRTRFARFACAKSIGKWPPLA
jgi:hypothetical protein